MKCIGLFLLFVWTGSASAQTVEPTVSPTPELTVVATPVITVTPTPTATSTPTATPTATPGTDAPALSEFDAAMEAGNTTVALQKYAQIQTLDQTDARVQFRMLIGRSMTSGPGDRDGLNKWLVENPNHPDRAMAHIYALFWGKDAKDWKDVTSRLEDFRADNNSPALSQLADFIELFMLADLPTRAAEFLTKYDAFVANDADFSGLHLLRQWRAMAFFYTGDLTRAETELNNWAASNSDQSISTLRWLEGIRLRLLIAKGNLAEYATQLATTKQQWERGIEVESSVVTEVTTNYYLGHFETCRSAIAQIKTMPNLPAELANRFLWFEGMMHRIESRSTLPDSSLNEPLRTSGTLELEAFLAATVSTPDDSQNKYYRVMACMELEQYDQAITEADEWLAAYPYPETMPVISVKRCITEALQRKSSPDLVRARAVAVEIRDAEWMNSEMNMDPAAIRIGARQTIGAIDDRRVLDQQTTETLQ